MRKDLSGLKWADDGLMLRPRWTFEPEREQIERIVRQVLLLKAEEACEICFHASGSFNKLYRIKCSSTTLLFRASLPVDPHYKTASEVATIRYLQRNTKIPVPKIYAYSDDLTWNDEFGEMRPFEWILMEFMPGQSLGKRWRKLSMEAKSALVRRVAQFQVQLLTVQSPLFGIGSIYDQDADYQKTTISFENSTHRGRVTRHAFRLKEFHDNHRSGEQDGTIVPINAHQLTDSRWHLIKPNSNQEVVSEGSVSLVESEDSATIAPPSASFKLGRIVSPQQFWADNYWKPIHRGPYQSSQEWLRVTLSLTQSGQERVIQQSEDDEEVEEAKEIKKIADRLAALLPSVFLHEICGPVRTALKHIDLSMRNILVDDEGEITAIVDWECTPAVPLWLSLRLPNFLGDTYRLSRPVREMYADESEEAAEEAAEEGVDNEGKAPLYWIHLLEYELTVLRPVYLNEMKASYPSWGNLQGMMALADFEFAISRCSSGFGLGVIESWLDNWEKGGQYWSLIENLWA